MQEAAGGVLWRQATGRAGVDVAVVHRPKYDDWSLPKGKLDFDEHPVVAAVREVREETGFAASAGRLLGETRYFKDGSPKRVRYFAMACGAGSFVATDEVDELRWLAPGEAAAALGPDRGVLEAFLTRPAGTWPCVVVRHGRAGDRASWRGPDDDRPLDEAGDRQGRALVAILAAYGVQRVVSADVRRCVDTVGPFAAAHGVRVELEPLLGESGYLAGPDAAVERLLEIAAAGRPTAVCSQGGALPGLVGGLAARWGSGPAPDGKVGKGGFVALHLTEAEATPALVAADRFPPVA